MNLQLLTFWIGIAIVVYSYLGYGILLYFIVRIKKMLSAKPTFDNSFEPYVSLVVPCFNEADYIEDVSI